MFVFLFTLFFHCRSFSHRRYIIFKFFFQRNWSPLLFISHSGSFPVIQVNVDFNIYWKERLVLFCCVFLSKSPGGHVIYWRNERCAWNVRFHLSFNILLPRRADFWLPSLSPRVCMVSVRSYADVITKFSRMDRLPNFLSYGGSALKSNTTWGLLPYQQIAMPSL